MNWIASLKSLIESSSGKLIPAKEPKEDNPLNCEVILLESLGKVTNAVDVYWFGINRDIIIDNNAKNDEKEKTKSLFFQVILDILHKVKDFK